MGLSHGRSFFRSSPGLFLALCWCALFLSVAAVIDVVIDLVFEEPILAESLEDSSVPEETENITENLLMPSQRADAPAGPQSASLLAIELDPIIALDTLLASPKTSHPPRHDLPVGSRAAPFLLSLRI